MLYIGQGIDQLRVISDVEMEAVLTAANIGFIAFYLYSPCQQRTQWTPEAVSALTDLGLKALPIYVGSQAPEHGCASDLSTATAGDHARDAATRLEAFGYLAGQDVPCVLDVEAATFAWKPVETADYAAAWAAELWRCGYLPTLYGDAATLRALAPQLWMDHQLWLASWTQKGFNAGVTTRGAFAYAGLEGRPGRRIVQYASQERWEVTGRGYDWNAADAVFAPAF